MTKKTKKETQIFLSKTVQKLGLEGNLIRVKSGYARNYLLPKGIGILTSPTSNWEQEKIQLQEEKKINQFLKIKELLESIQLFSIEKRIKNANKENGLFAQIFGTVTSKQIIEVLSSKTELSLTNTKINSPEIKETGTFLIDVILHPKVVAKIKLEIIPK